MGNVAQANYAASKSGLFGLTKTLAREAAFQLKRAGKLEHDGVGITVNTGAPGVWKMLLALTSESSLCSVTGDSNPEPELTCARRASVGPVGGALGDHRHRAKSDQ